MAIRTRKTIEPNLVAEMRKELDVSEIREWEVLDKKTSRMWRNFWIKAAHRRGYSNVLIAKEFEISESTVRLILKTLDQDNG